MKSPLMTLFGFFFLPFGVCFAQSTVTVTFGEKASIPIKIDTGSTCNVEVTLAGKREQITVEPTNPQILIAFEGNELGVFDLKWEGKFRPRGLKSVAACDGGGTIKVSVQPNTEKRKAEWAKFFSGLSSETARLCVKVGLQQKGLVFESIDPQARLESVSSTASREVFSKCDSFLSARTEWGSQDRENFTCTLNGGVRTRCRGVYAERMPDGRLRTISFEDALKFHFEGRSWTTGISETQEAKAEREEQSRASADRREAEIAANKEAQEKVRMAKIEADERERKFKESPEYKKQQAELERQRAAEARAADERSRKEKEAAEIAAKQFERQRAAEEKAAEERLRRQQENEQRAEMQRKAEAQRKAQEEERRKIAQLAGLKIKNVGLGVGSVPCTVEDATYVDILQKPVRLQYQCRFGPKEDQTLVIFASDKRSVVSVTRRQFLKPSDPEPGSIVKAAVNYYGLPVFHDEGNWTAMYGDPYLHSYQGRRISLSENPTGYGLMIKGKLCGDGRFGTEQCGGMGTTVIEYELVNQRELQKSIDDGKLRQQSRASENIKSQKF